jgi:hypothetical protein
MATFDELAKGYAERLNNAELDRRIDEFRKIESEINSLVYTNTKTKISDADKADLYEGIRSRLKTQVSGYSLPGNPMFECANDELMVLIDSVIGRMKGK